MRNSKFLQQSPARVLAALFLAAFGGFALLTDLSAQPATNSTPPPSAASTSPFNNTAPAPAGSKNPAAQPIETSSFANATTPEAQQALLVKVETLLDRAHFSPGVIDGKPGENLHNALAAYAAAHGLASDGTLTAQLVDALTAADRAPVTQDYTITADDEKGPFVHDLPTDFTALSKLKHLGYRGPVQELAERFHMSEALLRALNQNADFGKTGATLLVLRPGNDAIAGPIARIEVDKGANQVRVFDGTGTIIAVFPATVGSTERPAPSGRWAVKSVTFDPNYVYDPKRLTFKKARHKITIAPGPNNPVGAVWIALTKETYGIHGSPDPSLVGKTASHGCVRLTNWDATALGHAVKKGTPVVFVGHTDKG